MSEHDDDGRVVLPFTARVPLPDLDADDGTGDEPAEPAAAGDTAPAPAAAPAPSGPDGLAPPLHLVMSGIPEVGPGEDTSEGAFTGPEPEDPDAPGAKDALGTAMSLMTAMGVAAAQGMWHRSRQRKAHADTRRAAADKAQAAAQAAKGKTAGGTTTGRTTKSSSGMGGLGGGRRSSSSGGGSRGTGGAKSGGRGGALGPIGRGSGSGKGPTGGRSGTGGGKGATAPGGRPGSGGGKAAGGGGKGPSGTKGSNGGGRGSGGGNGGSKGPGGGKGQGGRTNRGGGYMTFTDTKRPPTGPRGKKDTGTKARWFVRPAGTGTRPGDAKSKERGKPTGPGKSPEEPTGKKGTRWFFGPKGTRPGEGKTEDKDTPTGKHRFRWSFRPASGTRPGDPTGKTWWTHKIWKAGRDRRDRARWHRSRTSGRAGFTGDPWARFASGSWTPPGPEDSMRPPPGFGPYRTWAEQIFDEPGQPEPPEPQQPAVPAAARFALAAGAPASSTPDPDLNGEPVPATTHRPGTQYAGDDAELTIHDVIEADTDTAEQITAGLDQARSTAESCDQLYKRLEALHARVVELRVPGALEGMVLDLMDRTATVKAHADAIAEQLPAAAEAIATAGSNAEARHRPLADAVRDAGHARPAERDYHNE